ncbi:hypothetical protein DEJ45_11735 [Streptomyces venezuelae]|uniref:hypothetical protein n=1 Tax=Streptomyces venezuelae TaxID=54571 RepID=UPI00123C7DCA|nr:hypothetical protein [Streptomyces venezuelae]QES13010.1 hypothetical protein DEJ45_11735 [Streptomyces venezuelae]
MKAKTCVFCGSPVAKKGAGEHVYPSWWLQMWREADCGPFYAQLGDEYIRRREQDGGELLGMPELQPIKLYEVCGSWKDSPNCNGKLNELFETSGRSAVEAVWRSQAVLVQEQVAAFAAWWVKTLLLANHPLTKHTFPRLEKAREREQARKERERSYPAVPGSGLPLLPLLCGSELIPPDLSLWLAVGDDSDGQHSLDGHQPIGLPTIHYGARPAGRGTAMGDGPNLLHSSRRVLLGLLHHPYATVAHPFERAGLAIRLWPDPPEQLDINALPVLDSTGIRQFDRQFALRGGDGIGRDESEGPLLLHACSNDQLGAPWPYCGCAE